jgi:hypothetical protein
MVAAKNAASHMRDKLLPLSPHLLRMSRFSWQSDGGLQGLAVDNYSVAFGRRKAGATSTFAQLG